MKRTILTLVLVCALIATVVPVNVFAFIEPSLHDQEKTTQILSSSANRLGAEQKISFSTSQFEYSFFANVNGLLIYKDVLDQIYTALVQGKYVVQQYSNQIGTISDVGFYFQDIDKDGNPELFIGSTDSYLQDRIMSLYTYCDGKIFEVASSDVRWGYYLTEGNQFYYFRSAGYADYVQEICELNDGVMVGKSSLISSNLSSILYYYSSESEPIHQISKSQYESYNQSFKPPIKSLQLTLFEKYDLNYIAVNNVSLSPVTLSLTVGNSSALTATVLPSNASNKEVRWSSSDPSVATVSNGLVTAVGEGTATITATTVDGGFSAQCNVTVSPVYSDDCFVIGQDSNQYIHYGLPYVFYNRGYYTKLTQNASWPELWKINKELDGVKKEGYDIFDEKKNEVNGVCFGASLSMIYASQDLLDYNSILPGAQNYWDLGAFYDFYYDNNAKKSLMRIKNEVFSDVILYYHMTQHTIPNGYTASVSKGGWFFSNTEERLHSFLMSFVHEAMSCQETKKPFLFIFNEDSKGYHAVVVYGYSFNRSTNQHEIKIYDMNDYDADTTTMGPEDHRIMTVSSNYNSFSFQSHNMERKNTYLEDEWEQLKFVGIDKIFGNIPLVNAKEKKTASQYSKRATPSSLSQLSLIVSIPDTGGIFLDRTTQSDTSVNPVTTISVSAYQKFYLENAEGEYLSYDGMNYKGNMEVYDCVLTGSDRDKSYWDITIDQSPYYLLRETDPDSTFVVDFGERGYAVSSTGSDYIKVTKDGVTVNGTDIEFEVDLSSSDPECIMYTASGHSGGTVTVGVEDGNVTVTSNKPISDFGFLEYRDAEPTHVLDNETSNTFVIPISTLSFSDVPRNAYYYDAVQWAVDNSITSGTSATTFSPDATCTRAQMVTFLWRTAGCPVVQRTNPFVDVRSDAYYYNAVLWAVKNGITAGTSAARFSPEDTVTRDQAVTFLYRFAGSPDVSGGNAFRDVLGDAYYASAVQWAVSKQVTNGTGATTFSPGAPCTRAQTVTFLYRMQRLGVETTSAEGQSADDGKYGKITIGGHTVYIEFRDT